MNNVKNKTVDMTCGKPFGLLLKFALPILIGNIFQMLYNMVDAVIVGRFVSAQALAAVGAATPLYGVLVNLNMGAATGVGILAAQFFGAKREEDIRPLVINSFMLMTVSSILIGGLGYIFSPKLLVLLDTPEDILADSTKYIRLIFLAMLGSAFYNVAASVLRAVGDSKTPLYFLIFSAVLNTVLDVFCVTVVKMGVLGVAIATLLSQYIVAVLTLIYSAKKYTYFRFSREELRPDREMTGMILKAGVPLALQTSTIALSSLILQRFVNSFGSLVVAANTASGRWYGILNMPLSAFAAAVSTFVSQNIGAKKMDRIKDSVKLFWLFSIGFSLLVLVLGYLIDEAFIRLFVTDAEVIGYGAQAIRVYSTFEIMLANLYIYRAVINGAGDTRMSMWGGFVEIIFRVGFAALMIYVLDLGVISLWYAAVICWFITGLLFLGRYLSGKWKTKSFA